MMSLTNIKYGIIGCMAFLVCTSCASLQYRLDDGEIKSAFAKAEIPTKLSYLDINRLDRTVRVQSITQGTEDINLVFLHGSPSSLSAWRDYLKDSVLTSRVHLHAIDRPGYGYSDFGDALVSIDEQAKVIDEVVTQMGLKNVIAIGTSYGGPVAARLAIENKEVKAVIMISPAIDPENEKRIWQSDFTQFWLTRWLVPTGFRVAGDEKTTHAQELASIEKDWPQVTVPVTHIHGDADNLVPYVNVEYTKRIFSDIEIITIPDLGHEIAWERSELVIPYILQVVDGLRE